MGLNIKNEETHRLAEELAKLTAESMTAAVTQALRERLERVRRTRGMSLADRLVAIGKDCAAHLKAPFRTVDHGDLWYDQCGFAAMIIDASAVIAILRGSGPHALQPDLRLSSITQRS